MSIRRAPIAVVTALIVILIGASSASAVSAPNASLTPGIADPRVSQANIGSTICTRGYTTTVRNVSTQTKHQVYVEYGISRSAQRNYVIDHLVPLEVGGANDIKNLWPEPKADAKTKDKLEGQMRASVCNGTVTLTAAQSRFESWATAAPVPEATAPTAPPATDPPTAPQTDAPAAPGNGATAVCNDGTYSYAANHQGASSHHGGVAQFYR